MSEYRLTIDFRAFKCGDYISEIEYNRLPDNVKKSCVKVATEKKEPSLKKPKSFWNSGSLNLD